MITVISDINLHAAPSVSSAQEANRAVQTGRNAGCTDRARYLATEYTHTRMNAYPGKQGLVRLNLSARLLARMYNIFLL